MQITMHTTEELQAALAASKAEIERLRAALRDAHGLIDNELVTPWIIRHKLDDVLIGHQQSTNTEQK